MAARPSDITHAKRRRGSQRQVSQPPPPPTALENLPNDILLDSIASFLAPADMGRLRRSSRPLHRVLREQEQDEPRFLVEEHVRGSKWGNSSHVSTKNTTTTNFARHSGLWTVSGLRQGLMGTLIDLQRGRGPRVLDYEIRLLNRQNVAAMREYPDDIPPTYHQLRFYFAGTERSPVQAETLRRPDLILVVPNNTYDRFSDYYNKIRVVPRDWYWQWLELAPDETVLRGPVTPVQIEQKLRHIATQKAVLQ